VRDLESSREAGIRRSPPISAQAASKADIWVLSERRSSAAWPSAGAS
jgi:hypothetical protein